MILEFQLAARHAVHVSKEMPWFTLDKKIIRHDQIFIIGLSFHHRFAAEPNCESLLRMNFFYLGQFWEISFILLNFNLNIFAMKHRFD
jgi:hypothetical protein